MKRYLAITPARDEERFLPQLIDSMTSQSRLPELWIIIDDGSTDSTGEIAHAAARKHPWIEVHHLRRNRPRMPGGESVVMRFLPGEVWKDFDLIFRVDADVSFRPDFIELMIREFARDPKLGIASGTVFEPSRDGWREVPAPAFHTRGCDKLYSSPCFAAIGGLETGLGWDTIDEVRAMMAGFKTRSFRHIRLFHHRPQGSAQALWRGRLAAGRAAYQIGYSPIFMMARAIRRAFSRPPILGAAMLLAGYAEGFVLGKPRAASPELKRFVARQQLRRLLGMESAWR